MRPLPVQFKVSQTLPTAIATGNGPGNRIVEEAAIEIARGGDQFSKERYPHDLGRWGCARFGSHHNGCAFHRGTTKEKTCPGDRRSGRLHRTPADIGEYPTNQVCRIVRQVIDGYSGLLLNRAKLVPVAAFFSCVWQYRNHLFLESPRCRWRVHPHSDFEPKMDDFRASSTARNGGRRASSTQGRLQPNPLRPVVSDGWQVLATSAQHHRAAMCYQPSRCLTILD